VYYYGVSSSGGHYALDVLRFPGSSASTGSEREGWVRIGDELVSDVRPADVFGAPEGDSQRAYLLFYSRVR
jgi:ubiquitin carboxyl-terminal hydrolase 10